jgi:hypothetical protein
MWDIITIQSVLQIIVNYVDIVRFDYTNVLQINADVIELFSIDMFKYL